MRNKVKRLSFLTFIQPHQHVLTRIFLKKNIYIYSTDII